MQKTQVVTTRVETKNHSTEEENQTDLCEHSDVFLKVRCQSMKNYTVLVSILKAGIKKGIKESEQHDQR